MCPHPAASVATGRVELADIVRTCGEAYRQTHRLARCQLRAMRAVERCRTAALGGHRQECDTCGAIRLVYNSCRNRHCPKCQSLARQRWLEARQRDLLPVPYFHIVFTLPHEINPLAQYRPALVYDLLFHSVSETLAAFAADRLGGDIGVTALLHTWGRNLSQHIHLHCIVTGGALSTGGARWVAAPRGFLFPVHALSEVFRGKFLDALSERARRTGSPQADAPVPLDLLALMRSLARKAWVVYCKPPLASPAQVLDYLSRYTHRVALSNNRITGFDGQRVRFRWKDWRDGGRVRILSLQAEEFLRRFLQHVLPDGFVRIRHYGLLANRARGRKLRRCRALLGVAEPESAPEETTAAMMARLTGGEIERCPACKLGTLRLVAVLPPAAAGSRALPWDSS